MHTDLTPVPTPAELPEGTAPTLKITASRVRVALSHVDKARRECGKARALLAQMTYGKDEQSSAIVCSLATIGEDLQRLEFSTEDSLDVYGERLKTVATQLAAL